MKTRNQILEEIESLQQQLKSLNSTNTKSHVIYRYYRRKYWPNITASCGGYTFAFRITFDQFIEVGIARCSDDDNFNKEIGRNTAEDMLYSDPHVIPWEKYDPENSLVENYVEHIEYFCQQTRFQKTFLKYYND